MTPTLSGGAARAELGDSNLPILPPVDPSVWALARQGERWRRVLDAGHGGRARPGGAFDLGGLQPGRHGQRELLSGPRLRARQVTQHDDVAVQRGLAVQWRGIVHADADAGGAKPRSNGVARRHPYREEVVD